MAIRSEQMLPVMRVAELASDEVAERWLVEQLWCANAVGVIGGASKCAKTWLGLDLALIRSHWHTLPGQIRRCRSQGPSWSTLPRTRCQRSASTSRE